MNRSAARGLVALTAAVALVWAGMIVADFLGTLLLVLVLVPFVVAWRWFRAEAR